MVAVARVRKEAGRRKDSELKCFLPECEVSEEGYRCYTPLKASVVSSLTYLWHEKSASIYWTPFATGDVYKVGNPKGGLIPFSEMNCVDQDIEDMFIVGCAVTKCVG